MLSCKLKGVPWNPWNPPLDPPLLPVYLWHYAQKYYSRITLNAFWYPLFPKLCQHPPNFKYRATALNLRCNRRGRDRLSDVWYRHWIVRHSFARSTAELVSRAPLRECCLVKVLACETTAECGRSRVTLWNFNFYRRIWWPQGPNYLQSTKYEGHLRSVIDNPQSTIDNSQTTKCQSHLRSTIAIPQFTKHAFLSVSSQRLNPPVRFKGLQEIDEKAEARC